MKYIVTIEETLSKDYEVEADSLQEAIEIGIQAYRNGDFMIDGDSCVQEAQMHVFNEDETEEEWTEL